MYYYTLPDWTLFIIFSEIYLYSTYQLSHTAQSNMGRHFISSKLCPKHSYTKLPEVEEIEPYAL